METILFFIMEKTNYFFLLTKNYSTDSLGFLNLITIFALR